MKRLVVLGSGESGVGAAILGKQKGYDVFVSDRGVIKDEYKDGLLNNEIKWEEGKHSNELILNADVVVKSPGIPDTVPLVMTLRDNGVSVISEIEFASWYTDAVIIGITGSNGKTTTSMLTYRILKDGGLNVGLAGNIGDSFAKQVALQDYEYYVLELSSFQLDGIDKFHPHIAIITNLSPDHLDRYDYDYSKYIESKFRIITNQNKEDYLIYDRDDKELSDWVVKKNIKSKAIPFSLVERELKESELATYTKQGKIIIELKNKTEIMSIKSLALKGKHNTKNAMAASTVGHLLQLRKDAIRESLQNFEGVEHRLEKVLTIHNVQYINDSKATNVNAAYYALESMESPTVWIVGGVDKGNDYNDLMPLVREKVKAIVCLGVDNEKIKATFSGVMDVIIEAKSMQDAVSYSYRLTEKGDIVLLSPACASFDLFENYEERGREFKKYVRKL